MANENARLAIIKQGEVVSCLVQLSSVLQMGLKVSAKGGGSSISQAAPTENDCELSKLPNLITTPCTNGCPDNQLVICQTPLQVLHLPCSHRSVLQKSISTVNMHSVHSFSFAQSILEARCISRGAHDYSAGLPLYSVLTVHDHAQNLKN